MIKGDITLLSPFITFPKGDTHVMVIFDFPPGKPTSHHMFITFWKGDKHVISLFITFFQHVIKGDITVYQLLETVIKCDITVLSPFHTGYKKR